MIFRLMLMIVVLFAVFYGILHLCFTKGFLTRERLKKVNRVVALSFASIILVVAAVSFFAGVDHSL